MSNKKNLKDKINLEIALKIEKEKTRQLELLRDIKKIEKTIKEKELYLKRNKSVCLSELFQKKNNKNNSESDSESDSDYNCESDSDSESESNSESDSDSDSESKSHIDFIRDCINIKCKKINKECDTISLSSIDSDYDYEKEININ